MNNISAVILCRANSTRLKKKHFKKIGKLSLIETIINSFLKIKRVNEIYIATGDKKKNYIYEQKLKKKYKNKIKYFYHDNESNVNERIYKVSKKIKNNFLLTYSGDCPIVEDKYIEIIHNEYLKNKNFDFIKIKNCIIEGIDLYRKELWKKINSLSKSSPELREFPGYIIKKKPFLFTKKNLCGKKIKIYQSKNKHLRLSIDTQSDLDFFNAIFYLNPNKKKIDYQTIYKYKNLNILNSHVVQKKNSKILLNKIIILSIKSQKFGLGHFSRSETIAREINETITSDVKKFIIRSDDHLKIDFLIKKIKSKNYTNKIFIIDLPIFFLDKLKFLFKKNKVFVIDNIVKHKNAINIIPSLRDPKIKKANYFFGKDALILKRNINYINQLSLKEKKYIFIFPGFTGQIPKKIINYCIKNKDLDFVIFSKEKNLNIKNIKYIKKNDDFFKITKEASFIITRFGVYVYECLALNKKVFIWDFQEKQERLKDINFLNDKKYIKVFNTNNFREDLINFNNKKLSINPGCNLVLKRLKFELKNNKYK